MLTLPVSFVDDHHRFGKPRFANANKVYKALGRLHFTRKAVLVLTTSNKFELLHNSTPYTQGALTSSGLRRLLSLFKFRWS